ncbi:DNA translocase [Lachancea thermotolerans CBS 6340]|uniref:KLTH0H15158p n=1 Tax=Lachancea thermotolerans (strain ATCC 56472 / CBS 6340 / NRRL Y-8284) TaxID=559295 RepID=C5E3P0_LACTC|nr:KLTH0H15158p [Lachancea thermotolerans CBS 6340]CAR30651.1 KLTH0H15158p [Lachancea thermotolerans CBS 6340]
MGKDARDDAKYWKERKSRYILHSGLRVDKQKQKDETYERFRYLLKLTDLFRHFISVRAKQDKNIQKLLKSIDQDGAGGGKLSEKRSQDSRHYRKSEKEEDAELLEEEEDEGTPALILTESPSYIKSGTLRDYQIQGLNWLLSLHDNKLSGILADEMGLGKTLQTIAFLGYLRYVKGIDGPHIIIVPKSTLNNWKRELAKWTPEVNTVVLSGDKYERQQLLKDIVLECKFDVLITSYEMVIREKATLKRFRWQYIIVDEAHRIKNEESALSQIIRLFHSEGRLLITGTPLQNNLHELWALLNFLLPDVFGDSDAFDEWFQQNNTDEDQEVVVQQLHTVLSPFLLRRLKSEVETSLLPKIETNLYVGMTDMQVQWYKSLLEKDLDAVNGAIGKREGNTRLLNIVMQLRKCCNHPYLFEGAEPGPPYTTDEHLIFNAGKMIVLDKLLKKKREAGSRVLIFSQMSRLLDILEDYCFFREYSYCRIDGSTSHEERIDAIDQFNEPNSDKFIFLLTTRAGGLGINLVTADTVVLYDSDWNPQADLQAMDRAHRIGQKKQVYVYRFVTENAIEEKVIERAAQKLRLDQLVIQQGVGKKTSAIGSSKGELLGMIQFGAKDVFGKGSRKMSTDDDIEEILRKGEQKTHELNAKYEKLGLDDLQKFNGLGDQSAYEWNGENFQKKINDQTENWINPSRRERRRDQVSYIDDSNKDGDGSKSMKSSPQPRMAKPPKLINVQDFQFFPSGFKELQEKEQLSFRKKVNYRVSAYDLGLEENDIPSSELSERVAQEQAKIDSVGDYTEEDERLKQELIHHAFTNWTKREFLTFISSCAKYGRDDFSAISESLDNKTIDEVKAYAKVFWERHKELNGYEKYLNTIEGGEKKADRLKVQGALLREKVEQFQYPMQEMTINYPPKNSRKTFDQVEDRFILMAVNKYGLSSENLYDKVKQDIMKSDLFRFNWFFKSRTAQEISKRANTLLSIVTREFESSESLKRKQSEPKKDVSIEGASQASAEPVEKKPKMHEISTQ